MNSSVPLKEVYDRVASGYSEYHKNDVWGYDLIKEMLGHLNPRSDVIDIGCGPGKECRFIKKCGFSPLGIDFSRGMIELAQTLNPQLPFQTLDITNLNQLGRKFEAVLARSVLLHLPRQGVSEVLGSIADTLSDGGWLYLTVKEGQGEEVVTECKYGDPYERPFTYFTENEMSELLERAGFVVKKVIRHQQKDAVRLQVLAQKT